MAAEHKRKDEEILAGLGYKQEFKRAFKPLEVFGIGFSIIGLLPSIASTIGFALPNGGPVALVWGWTIVSVFVVFIGLALGELASAAPTSGGLYYWTYKYASPEWRCVLSWVVGYCNTMGNASGVASVAWGGAVQLMAAVSIGSNMTFAPTTAQLYGVFLAILVLAGIVSSAATHLIARLQGIYVYLNVLLCLAIIVGLPAATPSELKNTADYAFTGFDNLSGWTPGFAFVLSFLAPLWTIGGFDGPIHISEEASNAATAVPWAIVSAIGITGVLGFAVNVAFSFNMGTDMAAIMSNPIGQPMATIFFNSFGTRGTLALWSVVVLIQFMMCTSILTSCSRQAFAFSRDGALPFSRFLYRMNPRTRTPVNCVWAAVLVAAVLGLLAFAGPSAINAIFSLGVTGQYLAFCLPIGSRFLGGSPWRPGPFSLGSLGMPVSLVAVLWMIFSVITVCFPAAPNPDGKTMNYTVVVAGGWISLCLTYFYFPKYGGRYWFKGPISNVELETPAEQVSVTDSDEKASQ